LAQYGLALEHLNQQNWDDASAAFDRALAVDAKYSAAYYHKARAQIAAGRSDEARATLNTGIEVSGAAGDWKTQNEMRELLETFD
jgi:tetratricopeptide (TPR) repeat protein